MNYKETLLFVAKCLTITHERDNRKMIEEKIKANTVDWDAVVKVSTAHYVFPALYCNLNRANFLHYLPTNLVEYMQHITNLNRERNKSIITEAKEINKLLVSNNITPIFLKGTGNLLEGLYQDIAERMVGDIDFLVKPELFNLTVNILKENGYKEKTSNYIDNTVLNRHYPKITKEGKIAAVEVHYKMITNEKGFDYNFIKNSLKRLTNNTNVLSYENQVLLTSFNKQINDKGQWFKSIALRNSYDIYMLSKKASIKTVLNNFYHPESDHLKNFLATTSYILNSPQSLEYTKTHKTKRYINKVLFFMNNPKKSADNKKKWELYFLYKHRFSVILKSFYLKKYRKYLFDIFFNQPKL
ncbi:putative nucleotidyltransferase-like protein [Tenacibaculum gallaicum]|uniref:Putative nucleotidyltransferase-like protein n=1 Tax=Tenacibaculum gallaicum TaxID=561505 RepID=A0A3E0I811_9FLAO|nr:nucleotidyltransferase family protein [Tenacibaculum gallaicum]REH54751.1 putative nucleotidyltransferase-like protein [Tenacibaculum gallaicum]